MRMIGKGLLVILLLVAGAILGAAAGRLPMARQLTEPDLGNVLGAWARSEHRLALQVNSRDPEAMNLALNNASNVEQYYSGRGEKVQIEIVTFGPGLHMLREDTSPVKDRIRALSERSSSISFAACDNTRSRMSQTESREIPLVAQATVVASGVVRLLELQEKGWAYVRP